MFVFASHFFASALCVYEQYTLEWSMRIVFCEKCSPISLLLCASYKSVKWTYENTYKIGVFVVVRAAVIREKSIVECVCVWGGLMRFKSVLTEWHKNKMVNGNVIIDKRQHKKIAYDWEKDCCCSCFFSAFHVPDSEM